jgi:hypothetical protein
MSPMPDRDSLSPTNVEPIGPNIRTGPYPAALEETIADLRTHLSEDLAREAAATLRRMFDRANRWVKDDAA